MSLPTAMLVILSLLLSFAASDPTPSSLPIKSQLPSSSKTLLFYVELHIGTPPVKTHLALDTMTPLTWVQCATCEACEPSTLPDYDPRKSTSFRLLPPTHPICKPPLAQPFGPRECHYHQEFISDGLLAIDRLHFSAPSSSTNAVAAAAHHKLALGCGINNFVDLGVNTSVAGLIGLAKGHPASILSQMEIGRMSFCLPGPNNNSPADTHKPKPTLDLGHKARISGHHVQTASLFKAQNHLVVNLTSLTFNETIPGGITTSLSMQAGESLVIDTLSRLTVVSEDLYGNLRGAAIDHFRNLYGWLPKKAETSESGLDLCYKLGAVSADKINLPRVGLHFHGGGTFEMLRLFQALPEYDEFCMVLLSKKHIGPSVLGSFQLMQYKVLFDFNKSTLSFAANRC